MAPANVKKWIVASHSGAAVWGPLTDAIKGELSAEVTALNIDLHKLTAYLVIPKSIRELSMEFVDRYFMAILSEAMQDGLVKGWGAYKNSKESPEYLASAFLKNFERAGVEVESERRSAARKWYDYLTKYADGSQVIEKAVEWAISIANDNSHGYDQAHRDGPDYDCSSLICWAYYNAGLNTRPGYTPATGAMYDVFLAAGFKDVTSQVNLATGSGLIRGDVLLKPGNHTEMSIGNGQLVAASQNEFGGITGGQTGDQTGKEIHVHGYYNFPWKYVLRYPGGGVAPVQGLYIVRWIPG